VEYILYESKDRIASITLNRPEARTAQNTQFLDELDACWTKAAEDDDVRVIVLKANGKHFSSGHDISVNPGEKPPVDIKKDGLAGI
jgi:enoyl-CoA hydratase/carnithine racemase